ncbi:hypothetical protein SCANM63S_05843 [Streptomyces canarius]
MAAVGRGRPDHLTPRHSPVSGTGIPSTRRWPTPCRPPPAASGPTTARRPARPSRRPADTLVAPPPRSCTASAESWPTHRRTSPGSADVARRAHGAGPRGRGQALSEAPPLRCPDRGARRDAPVGEGIQSMANRRTRHGGWRSGALLVAAVVGAPLLSATPAVAVHGAVPGDFNGDGYRDAVLPAPGANVAGKTGAGAVVVLYGSASGLSTSRRVTITQNSAGVPGAAEADDGFGSATATADLNRDGFADLVVSAPYEDTGRGEDAGMVTVLWGSKKGLTSGTDLPATTAGAYYGLDVAALSTGPGTKTEVLVAGYEGAMSTASPSAICTNCSSWKTSPSAGGYRSADWNTADATWPAGQRSQRSAQWPTAGGSRAPRTSAGCSAPPTASPLPSGGTPSCSEPPLPRCPGSASLRPDGDRCRLLETGGADESHQDRRQYRGQGAGAGHGGPEDGPRNHRAEFAPITAIRPAADGHCRALAFVITPGQAGDARAADSGLATSTLNQAAEHRAARRYKTHAQRPTRHRRARRGQRGRRHPHPPP